MGRMFFGPFGRNTCVSGVAETPATWVIPGGDSAPTKMTTHLGDSRSEAEHHQNLWAELCSCSRAETPALNRAESLAVPQYNHEAKPQVSNGTEPEVLGGTFVPHAQGGDSGPRGGDSDPWNFSRELRVEIPVQTDT